MFFILISGGWCKAETVSDITGSVCIEFGNHTYVKALDTGYFTIGPPHDAGKYIFRNLNLDFFCKMYYWDILL